MRGEVRLYQFSRPDKRRPVLVLTRAGVIAHLSTVTVAPISSTIRGVPSEVVLTEDDGMKTSCAVNMHNLITVPKVRLGRRLTTLSSERLGQVCSALAFALGCS